jgi:hypothetical protein
MPCLLLAAAEVLRLKALVRRGEADAACRYVGVPPERVHHLNLPFYESGRCSSAQDCGVVGW